MGSSYSGLPSTGGSGKVTSKTAVRSERDRKTCIKSSSTTWAPRPVLMKVAYGGIFSKSALFSMPFVWSLSARWLDTTEHSAKMVSMDALVTPSSAAFSGKKCGTKLAVICKHYFVMDTLITSAAKGLFPRDRLHIQGKVVGAFHHFVHLTGVFPLIAHEPR